MALYGPRVDLPARPLVHLAVEEHARRFPGRPAVTCGAQSLTYAELNARANRFANHLISRGIGRGSVVGVCVDRSAELVTAILGILKSGAAYVPLDPTYPPKRLRLMFSQLSQVQLIAVSAGTRVLVENSGKAMIDMSGPPSWLDSYPATAPAVELDGDDLCYVVFTSGSTGAPKAVAVRHEGWYNLLNYFQMEFGLDDTSSNLMLSAFGFDLSQRSIMTPLFTGAALHLLPGRSLDISMAYRLIGELGVRTLHCATSAFYLLVERETRRGTNALAGLRYAFIGGERLSPGRIADWATREGNSCLVLNQYGAAECTDVSTSHPMRDFPAYRAGLVPVGKPLYNTEIRILDENLDEVPDGQTGEICISGTGLGAGYLNVPVTERSRFTTVGTGQDAFRLYRSGDRGYLTPTGELVVVGRADAQVKIRGMRIDLGDVQHAVCGNPTVKDAVVLALPGEENEPELVAFVIPAADEVSARSLRQELSDVLPRNMVPGRFVGVPAFPMTPNGKVDRTALAELDRNQRAAG